MFLALLEEALHLLYLVLALGLEPQSLFLSLLFLLLQVLRPFPLFFGSPPLFNNPLLFRKNILTLLGNLAFEVFLPLLELFPLPAKLSLVLSKGNHKALELGLLLLLLREHLLLLGPELLLHLPEQLFLLALQLFARVVSLQLVQVGRLVVSSVLDKLHELPSLAGVLPLVMQRLR